MSRFILRIDDVAPGMAWDKLDRLRATLDSAGVRPIVGVVPDCRDRKLQVGPPVPDFWDRIRDMRDSGWAIAQHGFTHVYDSEDPGLVGSSPKSEFAGHPFDVQFERLRAGKAILESEGCWQPYFMAPSHSFDDHTLLALEQLSFVALTDGYGLYPYREGRIVCVPQLFSRPIHVGVGVYTLCLHLNGVSIESIDHVAHFICRRAARFMGFPEAIELSEVPRWEPQLRGTLARVLPRLRTVMEGQQTRRPLRRRQGSATDVADVPKRLRIVRK